MLSSLALATALFVPAAPAPRDPAPAPAHESPTGQPPRIVELKPNADGKVLVSVTRPGNNQAQGVVAIAIGGANGAPIQQKVIVNGGTTTEQVELSKIKDLKVTTAGGKELTLDVAQKAIEKGAMVLVSAEKVSPVYLRLFREDVLVLVSPELASPNDIGGFGRMKIGGFGGGIAPAILPIAPPQPVPAPVPEK